MNTSIQQETTTSHAADEWRPRPALREALDIIASVAKKDESAVICERSMTFRNQAEQTTVSVEPVNVDTLDGQRISEHITIHTPLTMFKLFDEGLYSTINVFATTGAIVRGADGEDAVISRLPVFEGDDRALTELYAPLIAKAMLLQLLGPLCGMYHFEKRKDEVAAANIGLPDWDQPSFWGPEEFTSAERRLKEAGAFTNAGANALTVEFPWEQGAVSAIAGDRTSLFQVRADVAHPSAGNGLYYRLDLPLTFDDEEAKQCAAKLNRTEAEGIDTPPYLGAWCSVPKSGTVSFVGFWPNFLYVPGTVSNLVFWSWSRSRIARQLLGNLH